MFKQADEPPVVDQITAYDRDHLAEYLALLYAASEGQTATKMARDICGIDPEAEPIRAKRVVAARLARARWLAENGQELLLDGEAFAKGVDLQCKRRR